MDMIPPDKEYIVDGIGNECVDGTENGNTGGKEGNKRNLTQHNESYH